MEDNRITIPIKTSVVQFFKQTLKAFFISAVIPYIFYALISFFTTRLDYEINYGSSYYSSSGFYAKTENTKKWYLKGHNQQNTGNSSHSQNEEYQQGSIYN